MQKIAASTMLVLNVAKLEAALSGSCFVEPEHLLLGLLRASDLGLKVLLANAPADLRAREAEMQSDLKSLVERWNGQIHGPTRLRRQIRRSLGKKEPSVPVESVHRSTVSLGLFNRAHIIARRRKDSARPSDLWEVISEWQRALAPDHPLARFAPNFLGAQEGRLPIGSPVANGEGAVDEQVPAEKPPPATGALDQFGRDLTVLARRGHLESLIGRKGELLDLIRALSQKRKANPLLLGEPGVGKTAIVEGLAQLLASDRCPEGFEKCRVVELSLSKLVAGTKYRGDFEARLNAVLKEAGRDSGIILFIDELHILIGAGGTSGAMDAANLLKPALARGDIRMIGATTDQEYRRHIAIDQALARRFQTIWIEEPTRDEAVELLLRLKEEFERHHQVNISTEAIHAAVDMSLQYLREQRLPAKAIDVLDQACASARFESISQPNQSFSLRVEVAHIAAVISRKCNIAESVLNQDQASRLNDLETAIQDRIKGQDETIRKVAAALKVGSLRLRETRKPIASFLFAGPSGTGKTELAKVIAKQLYGSEAAMIRLDMSEFMQEHNVARLIGAPPGYLGYHEGGKLTEAVHLRPASVILLDEIEKAHPRILDLFLQVLDEGLLTDSQGRAVSFREAVIVMTSNLGAATAPREIHGFAALPAEQPEININSAIIRQSLRPEFLNRITLVAHFDPLSKSALLAIADLKLRELEKWLAKKNVGLTWTESVAKCLAESSIDPRKGARQLDHLIEVNILDRITDAMLQKHAQYRKFIIEVNGSQIRVASV